MEGQGHLNKKSSSHWPMYLSNRQQGISAEGRRIWEHKEACPWATCHPKPPLHKTVAEVNTTRRRVVTRVLPGSLHFKSLQEKSRRAETKAGHGDRSLLKSEKSLWGGGTQTNQLNLDLIANLEEFHSWGFEGFKKLFLCRIFKYMHVQSTWERLRWVCRRHLLQTIVLISEGF